MLLTIDSLWQHNTQPQTKYAPCQEEPSAPRPSIITGEAHAAVVVAHQLLGLGGTPSTSSADSMPALAMSSTICVQVCDDRSHVLVVGRGRTAVGIGACKPLRAPPLSNRHNRHPSRC